MPSRPSSSPQPQHQPFQSPVDTTLFGARPDPSVLSGFHPPSASALDAQTRKLAATLSKKALSGKPRGQPRTRFNGFAHMSDCIYLDSVSTADGITMNVGGYQNAGSVITKMPMPPIQHQEA
ncbi:hypothetical protein HYDPIDRAFT_117715 [Hydnomerulius pinastri MD-312]|uniref:Uncharacterized protein n=1 Tax=Hydnomerulius pinastri MD-312 TaxID=994086 RepID=A0A0C9W250_9AGAM|nr:hypothetical protein HYDPIDRAFT_117715 [Hydnomerulius pinastri MD-312]